MNKLFVVLVALAGFACAADERPWINVDSLGANEGIVIAKLVNTGKAPAWVSMSAYIPATGDPTDVVAGAQARCLDAKQTPHPTWTVMPRAPWPYALEGLSAKLIQDSRERLQIRGCVIYKYAGNNAWHHTPFYVEIRKGGSLTLPNEIKGVIYSIGESTFTIFPPLTVGTVD